MVDFISDADQSFEQDSLLGDMARNVMGSQEWAWIKANIMDHIFNEAVKCMRVSRTEDQRARAQAMLIAHDEVFSRLNYLINKGDAAKAALKSPTLTEEESYA